MHLDPRLTAGLAAAIALSAQQAQAQTTPPVSPPETLEAPYEDPPPPPPPASVPPPPSAAPAAPVPPPAPNARAPELASSGAIRPNPDTRPLLQIRARRKISLTGELGWNGLAGFGPVISYHVDPHFSLDLGAGYSLFGWKAGFRGRYNLLTSAVTPFLGVGFNAGTGLGKVTFNTADDPNADPTRDPVTVDLKDSYLIQGVVGLDFIHRRGFTLVGCLGYSFLLNRDNYDVLAGELTEDEEQGFEIAFKSGLVLSLALGYSFE